jgi:hypothetical protein
MTALPDLFSRGDRNPKMLKHQNRLKNDRKIVVRRRRRADCCNKPAQYYK